MPWGIYCSVDVAQDTGSLTGSGGGFCWVVLLTEVAGELFECSVAMRDGVLHCLGQLGIPGEEEKTGMAKIPTKSLNHGLLGNCVLLSSSGLLRS